MTFSKRTYIQKYAVAVLVSIAAIFITTSTLLATGAPFLFLLFAILISTWYGGLGPGLVATLLTSAAALYYLIPPGDSFAINTIEDAARYGFFILTALIATVITAERDRARLTAEVHVRRQETVAAFSQRALKSTYLDKLLAEVPALLIQVLDVEYSYVAEQVGDGAPLRIIAETGCNDATVSQAELPTGTGSQAGYTLLTQEPVIATDLRTETRFSPSQVLLDHGIVSGITVMISGFEKPFGVLGVFTNRRRVFDRADVQFLQAIANTLVAAIQRHREEAAVRREVEQALNASEQRNRTANQDLARHAVELKIANEELEAFSYSVSHDLRTPLTSIESFAGLVLQDYGSQLTEEGRRFLELIRDNAQATNRQVEALLRFSRTSRQPLNKQTVNMRGIVDQVLDELRPIHADRHVVVAVGELPTAKADPILIKLVWTNLVTNAIKYTKRRDPARIEIGSYLEGENTVYFVKDNGVGFDMAQADQLFGVFRRLHSEEDYEGTGVGLALVQRVIRRHGGRVWAEAEVEKGATFYYTLA